MKKIVVGLLFILFSMPLMAKDVWYSEDPSHEENFTAAAQKLATSLGGTATPFKSENSDHEWDDALASADVIFIGQSGVNNGVDGSTRADIGIWIEDGGILVTLRDEASVQLLNDTLGTSFLIAGQKCCNGDEIERTSFVEGSSFDLAPPILPTLNDHKAIDGGFEPDTLVAYEDIDFNADVLIQERGDGMGIYLSFDWCCGGIEDDDLFPLWDQALLYSVQYSGEIAAVADTAIFRVSKTYTIPVDMPVDVTLSCNGGTDLIQTFPLNAGEVVTFNLDGITEGTKCTVTEEVPEGWLAQYNQGDAVFSDEGCEYIDVTPDSVYQCAITNSPAPVDVTVIKKWEYENTEPNSIIDIFEIELSCETEIVGGEFDCGSFDYGWCFGDIGRGEDSFNFRAIPGYPKSTCRVREYNYDASVVSDNQCYEFEISIGQGYECIITNTAIYEGIPSLNQYGMALLALLMLGMGYIGMRRFV